MAKVWDIIGQKLWNILWDIFVKNCWIYLTKLWDKLVHWIYFANTKGCLRQNYGIYRANIMGYTMGYISEKLWDIFVKVRDLFRKIMGYIGPQLWDILG